MFPFPIGLLVRVKQPYTEKSILLINVCWKTQAVNIRVSFNVVLS